MSNSCCKFNYRSIIYAVISIAIMLTIFGFSSQNYESTMKTSDTIVKPIENAVKKDSSNFADTKTEKNYKKKLENKLDKAVRKSAHMTIFGVLGIFLYLFFKSLNFSDADAIILTLVICGMYGCTDEWHQKFVKGRTSQFFDVCVDEMGVVISMTVIRILSKYESYKKWKLR